ncbi:hypothetical protein COCC4DRAFT_29291, partial [Bipolaris maydis ATCC 48331]
RKRTCTYAREKQGERERQAVGGFVACMRKTNEQVRKTEPSFWRERTFTFASLVWVVYLNAIS